MIDTRTAGALCAAVALCLPTPALSQVPSPKRGPGAPGVTGAIVTYEEARGSAILYLEEKGGLVSSVPGAAPAGRGEEPAPAPLPKAQAPKAQPPRAPAVAQQPPKRAPAELNRVAQRKVAPSDSPVAKP